MSSRDRVASRSSGSPDDEIVTSELESHKDDCSRKDTKRRSLAPSGSLERGKMNLPISFASASRVSASGRSAGRRYEIQFFTIAEIAEMLRVSTRTVRRWIDCGQLAVHVFGGVVRIAETDLRAFLALHRQS